jgi:hypothetical protein
MLPKYAPSIPQNLLEYVNKKFYGTRSCVKHKNIVV